MVKNITFLGRNSKLKGMSRFPQMTGRNTLQDKRFLVALYDFFNFCLPCVRFQKKFQNFSMISSG